MAPGCEKKENLYIFSMSWKSLPPFPWSELIAWYENNSRHHLPWRQYDIDETIRLYRVWLAEILLQQTQVERVIPYFERILEKYPTIHDLALASYEEFFPYYQGMGYYSRARNMLKLAHIISTEYSWVFPRDKKLLQKLPGVWWYTSSAILAFGYCEPYLAWDTNLEKVFSRYLHGSRFQKLTDEEKWIVEEDFRKYVSKKWWQQKNEETEGWKLSESDENKWQMSEANEFFHPSEPFDTFQLWKVCDEKMIIRAINNALMDFAATVDLKNPENINWDDYPIHSGVWYDTRWSLEPREEKKSVTFPIPDATVIVILHQDHKVYYSPVISSTYEKSCPGKEQDVSFVDMTEAKWYTPFTLPPALHRDTRQYVQEYFRTRYGLELSVRPIHAKWITEDGKPYIAVNAQIQAWTSDIFTKTDKKSAQEVLKKIIP